MSSQHNNWQLKALLTKNLILMRKNVTTTICELLFPVALAILLAIIKLLFPLEVMTNIMTEAEFLDTNSSMITYNKASNLYGLNTKRTL